MAAIADFSPLYEGGFVARLRPGADLDDALLELAAVYEMDGYWLWREDEPTTAPTIAGEVQVEVVRKSPCTCGDHGWHLIPATLGKPGAFLALVDWG